MSLQIKTKIQQQSQNTKNSQENIQEEILFTTSFSWDLFENETFTFIFETPNNGTLRVGTGWGIYFENGEISRGVLASWESQNMTFSGTLLLKNLSGNTPVFLDLDSASGVLFPYNYYTTTQNIWGTSVVKSFWKVKE